jgi:hypothetical protein
LFAAFLRESPLKAAMPEEAAVVGAGLKFVPPVAAADRNTLLEKFSAVTLSMSWAVTVTLNVSPARAFATDVILSWVAVTGNIALLALVNPALEADTE